MAAVPVQCASSTEGAITARCPPPSVSFSTRAWGSSGWPSAYHRSFGGSVTVGTVPVLRTVQTTSETGPLDCLWLRRKTSWRLWRDRWVCSQECPFIFRLEWVVCETRHWQHVLLRCWFWCWPEWGRGYDSLFDGGFAEHKLWIFNQRVRGGIGWI